jgi:hypothetical protein
MLNTRGIYVLCFAVAAVLSARAQSLYGSSSDPQGVGVTGSATSAPNAVGVLGISGYTSDSTTCCNFGVYGVAENNTGRGVMGEATSTYGSTRGVFGVVYSNYGIGALGTAYAQSGYTRGVMGQNYSPDGLGAEAVAYSQSGDTIGVRGVVYSAEGTAGVFVNAAQGNLIVGQTRSPWAPTTVFRVDGTGKGFFDGGAQTGGADFAESVTVAGMRNSYAAGDVMAIDPFADRQLTLTAEPYSRLVAGVYSTKPGVLASSHKLDAPEIVTEIPLAVVGIVPCNVSAENGSIQRGDLLVSSSTPGYAMKGTDRQRMLGAILGKALEPLDNGQGMIQVLLILQ